MSFDRPTSSEDASEKQIERHGLRLLDDNLLTWDKSSPEHPRNWSPWQKTYNNAMIFWLEFFMTVISTSGTSAGDSARYEYGISRTLAYFAFTTVYLIGLAIGGMLCTPISEVFGRRMLYILASSIFCVFNLVVGVVPSLIAVFFGRFISGFVAAIPTTVAFGNFEDTHNWEMRIWIVYFYTLFGHGGLALGPIYAAYIDEALGWRWIFYIAAVATFVSVFLALGIKESNPTSILAAKVKRIASDTGRTDLRAELPASRKPTLASFIRDSIYRPVWLLFTQPIILLCSILCSIAYGLLYGLTEGLVIVYEQFGWPKANTSLAFLAIFVGFVINIIPRFFEQQRFRKYRHRGQKIYPETKIASFAVACPALAIGLWIFAWTIPPLVTNVHWIVSLIGLVFVGFAACDFAYLLFTYVADSYGAYAASAVGALNLSQTVVAAIFPLFTTQMFNGLGANWAVTILAATSTLFSLTPVLFFGWSAKLRDRSSAAVSSEDVVDDGLDDWIEEQNAKRDSERGLSG